MSYVIPKCELCSNEAIANFSWGLYNEPTGIPRTTPMYKADLCSPCSTELWNKCSASVENGNMHWQNGKHYKIDKLRIEILTSINTNQTIV